MKNEKRTTVYGAIMAIIALIAVIGTMNYYASGWDHFSGIQSSFLMVFLSFLGVVVVALVIGLWRWNRPKKQRRAKYAYHSSLRH